VVGVVKVRLGKGLRTPPPDLLLQSMLSQVFQELLKHIDNPQADVNVIRELVSRVNEDLKSKGYKIALAKAPPQSGYDYILRLTRKR
jgi:hemolysin activation/secretion protein